MKTISYVCLVALLNALVGCLMPGRPPLVVQCSEYKAKGRPGPALVGKEYGMQTTAIPLNSVQFSNWTATKQIAVQHLFASRTATDTVEVTARFVSCLDEPATLQMRTSFMDDKQAPSEPASAWQTVYLSPRAIATYSEKSISKNVASYLVEVASP